MITSALLDSDVQRLIQNFEGEVTTLAFGGSPFPSVSVQDLIQQIEGRRRIEKKLPTWAKTQNILYPAKLNLEQTSSEITAKYKASIVVGQTLADITGGFGVDSYFFAENFREVHHFETNKSLSELAAHNFKIFGKTNVECFAVDGLKAVLQKQYDVIFADPSRRHQRKGKVFFLKDCEPDIPSYISEIMDHCNTFLLKTSPMLDISCAIKALNFVSEIHIVAVENEVKELLWLLKKHGGAKIKVKTVNFTPNGKTQFDFDWAKPASATFGLPKKYLYEPNATILKSGAFDLVSEKFKVDKLQRNTHLYTSDTLMDFPGRRFLIEKIVLYNKANMRSALNFRKANITTKNFPESVNTLRKKWKISEGGDVFLFFVTDIQNNKLMLICSKP